MRNSKLLQTGAALIVSLVMLLVMTVLGVAAMQSVILEERMAGNYLDRNIAFQAAEYTLRKAEEKISTATAPPFRPFKETGFDGTNGLYDAQETAVDIDEAATTVSIGGADALAGLFQQPEYIIELINHSCTGSGDKALFRITAKAWGRNPTSIVELQTYFRLPIACGGGSSAPAGTDDIAI